jgi:hypothetical protein
LSILEKTLIAKAPVAAANSLKAKLAAVDIEVALAHNQATCSSGSCGTELEVWAHKDDVEEITRLLEGQWRAQMEAIGYDPNLANAVFDPEQEKATCPACATEFSTKQAECPECGLCFGGE